MLSRRTFLQTAAAATAAAAVQPKRIAVLARDYRTPSPAQQMTDRLLVGYPVRGAWHMPDAKVVSLFVAAKPEGELSASRASEFGFDIYPTVAAALCCSGSTLAVDAVLIFDEAGESALFEQCVQLFEAKKRAVPVFHSGPLSGRFQNAQAMLAASRRLRFPVLAGTSLPVTWRLPSLELPLGCRIEEALVVGFGAGRDFHALEALQCMVEHRQGGETGVKSVQLLEGDAAWKAVDAGRFSKQLLLSALSRSDTPLGLTETDGRPQNLVASGQLRVLATKPAAYFVEYLDGLKATVLMLDGAIRDFNFAARLKGVEALQSTQFLLTPEPIATHSACLMNMLEQMIATGAAPYPVERVLLAGGVLESGLASREQHQVRLQTPHLKLAYQPPRKSHFAQA